MTLSARNITLQINGNPILSGVDITLARGEMLGLIGPNGAGKTSLLRILANLQRAS